MLNDDEGVEKIEVELEDSENEKREVILPGDSKLNVLLIQ